MSFVVKVFGFVLWGPDRPVTCCDVYHPGLWFSSSLVDRPLSKTGITQSCAEMNVHVLGK